ncbi:MAG: hypothetical protein RLZZ414_918 [Bacteroidota bacterium]|jgi:hypothetical protein
MPRQPQSQQSMNSGAQSQPTSSLELYRAIWDLPKDWYPKKN